MSTRRVVITGVGLLSPLGSNIEQNWNNILAGKSAISKITKFDASNISAKIAGQIFPDELGVDFEKFIEPKDLRKMDDLIKYGMVAATEAFLDSNYNPQTDEEFNRAGVLIGSGIGGLRTLEEAAYALYSGNNKISPFFIPSILINLISGHVSAKYNLRGPNHSVVTACATGTHAIGDAFRLIKYGDADFMLAGGAEAAVTRLGVAGFAASRALSSKFNDTPEIASRPWDKGRDGFVMSEGAGILALEEYESAKKRGAKIYAEILGYGLGGDAYHITSPHPEGLGASNSMKSALKESKLNSSDIGYINAHATSTPAGDIVELNNIQKLFESSLDFTKMSSTKSSIGHMLGAAGSVEAIFTALSLKYQILPPTINLEDPEDDVKMDLVPNTPKEHKFSYAMSNSFGFGGTNASIILGKI